MQPSTCISGASVQSKTAHSFTAKHTEFLILVPLWIPSKLLLKKVNKTRILIATWDYMRFKILLPFCVDYYGAPH